MPYIELINKVMKEKLGEKGLEIVQRQVQIMGIKEDDIQAEHIPGFAKAVAEAVVSSSTREEAKIVYWELFKLLDIDSIVDGTEDPLLKAAQLADLGDANAYAGDYDRALHYYRQIPATAAPGCEAMAEIKEGELHATTNEQGEARKHFEKAKDIAREQGNFYMEALALRGIGYTCWRTGEFPEAVERFNKAISVALQMEDNDLVAKINIDMGLIHAGTGLHDKAIAKYNDAISILKETGDYDELARAYNNLGEVYKELKDYNKALESYQNCLESAEKVKNDVLRAYAYMNSAECYARMCYVDEARETLELGKAVLSELKDEYLESAIYLIYGLIAIHENDWECMEQNFEKDVEILKKIGYPYEVATNTIEHARGLMKKGDIGGAKKKLMEARSIIVSLSSTRLLSDIDSLLSELE
ncbi:MAG: tetratricopeptide repeat protein [Candidatus Thermoplasmatota archaeon]|nr:tetratricopeptide repeat protein [Candidatus Thermoplasmatota archaeon]